MPATRKFPTLQRYMEGTRTNASQLIAKVRNETGVLISPAMMSMILSGSRRCSRHNAIALAHVTGVPFDELVKWPNSPISDSSQANTGKDSANV